MSPDEWSLLKQAAKGAGLYKRIGWQNSTNEPLLHPTENWHKYGLCETAIGRWNPLVDDGDALRLAAQLRFAVSIDSYVGPHGFVRVYVSGSIPAVEEPIGVDALAATRLAIVKAAGALA